MEPCERPDSTNHFAVRSYRKEKMNNRELPKYGGSEATRKQEEESMRDRNGAKPKPTHKKEQLVTTRQTTDHLKG